MADLAHLEKMGRELKCPICLSLLISAVSLTCNHVFCNLCISKSSKSVSNCPVCKVPFRRREIRPVPHMDNLVSIYKSMEVASGINIFVTQPGPSTKKSDGENQDGFCFVSEKPETDKSSRGKPRKQTNCKQRRFEVSEKNKELNSQASVKPSFPAKKRVQVPLSPPGKESETPIRSKKVRKLVKQNAKEMELEENAVKADSILLKEKPDFEIERDPIFTPFFWLRDKEKEEDDVGDKRISQQTDADWVSDTPRHKTPCFSDLFDSEDASLEKMDMSGNSEKRSKVAKEFDNEMFEWTQRALSPELCCTPEKKQVADEFQVDGIPKNRFERAKKQNPLKRTMKNGKKTKTHVQKKPSRELERMKRSKNQIDGNVTETVLEVPTSSCQIPAEETLEKETEHVTEKHMNMEVRHLSSRKIKNGKTQSLGEKSSKSGKKTKTQVQEKTSRKLKRMKISENQTDGNVTGILLEEFPASSCQVPAERTLGKESDDVTEACMNMEIPDLSCQKFKNSRTQSSSKTLSKNGNITDTKVLKKPSTVTRLNLTGNAVTGKVLEEVTKNSSKFGKGKNITVSENKKNLDDGSSSRTVEILPTSAKDFGLRNCENVLSQIQCAFCRSCDDSEASGQMLHYFDGKPVAANYNGGSNIMHCHKNCAEWAPNVYFEDETAKNLREEIVRSKKIKCSLCGIKGASLGCFEKSCRKSFHVPCAKMIPECRWDDENFVMLCSIHSSSKLPKEIYGSEKRSRKRSSPKIECKSQVAVKHCFNESQTWKWPAGSPCKWVLCCSALSVAEKEIVTKFTRLAGISVSKLWSPSVTHVIASTDENGACRRTLKIMMGILEGKWILNIDWIKACVTKMEPVNEEKYEIRADIHGVQDGPQNGRLRIMEMKPKLFNSFKFYFNGDFVASYKGFLNDLVTAAGGTVLHRKPIAEEPTSVSTTFIIYSLELPDKCDSSKKSKILEQRHVEARMLASATSAEVVSHKWILDSIAACKLQPLLH